MAKPTDASKSKTASRPSLADPVACGEDLARNLKQMIAIAPQHCDNCTDYHIANATHRLLDNAPWRRGGRKALVDTVRPILAELAARKADPVDVVVAGSADTAVLSSCAHAAWLESESFLDRVRFTVLDRCRTPLILCEEYAALHGLEVTTNALDLSQTSGKFPADLIVLHNLLPFVSVDRQVGLLQTLGSWLREGGRVVLWQLVIPPDDREQDVLTRVKRVHIMKAMVDDGRIEINEPKATFFGRIEHYADDNRPGQPRSPDTASLKKLIASAGLEMQSIEELPHNCPLRSKLYVMIVAGRPSR